MTLSRKQIAIIIGAAVLFTGLFLPAISLKANNPLANIAGSSNYIQADQAYGVILLLLSLIVVALAIVKKFQWAFIAAVGTLGILVFRLVTFLTDISKFNSLQSSMNPGPFSPEFDGVMSMTQEIAVGISLNWISWIVMFAGSIITIVVLLREDKIREIK
ncbi:MAG TPA: hypothetical protein PLM80_02660 [Mesotoga sp.]|jgi:hypothetical protein|nr:hypothetical protein [Mesotoga sp.]MDI9374118.1 hypothetical protein [Thermotogota bacterium]MDD4041156.1 hypothetical protein [Mesotoga sp.]MDD5745581.1 hypothetical protein [Mesotoga sp.]HOY25833.1 hypothetical protein [Mesotoga sp.]